MAKIKFSALVSDVRNSLNGSTFARNRGGSYFRNKTTPNNPQTMFQTSIRSSFGSISSAWRGLTEVQRNSWIEGAANFPYTDIFGDSRTYSGNVLFQKLNQNLNSVGLTIINSCPDPQTVENVQVMSVVYDDVNNELTVTTNIDVVPANHALVIDATRGLSPGRSFAKNDFRRIQTVPASGGSGDFNIAPNYTARFGAIVTNQKIFVRVHLVNTISGQVSPISTISTIA